VANFTESSILWIDASRRLTSAEFAEFGDQGLKLQQVGLVGLSSAELSSADVVIIRPTNGLIELEQIKNLLQQSALTPVIVVRLGLDQFELGIEAMKRGVGTVVSAENTNASEWVNIIADFELPKRYSEPAYVFVDPTSRKLLALTERVAETDVTVLLAGPTGSGKEVLARILHESSPRHAAPFVAFNCAAMSESLIEDMLFGHEKGSFTGATKAQPGLFEQAQSGTIFLDEVGEMSFQLQAKLLRVLQERTVTRLGGQKPVTLDLRVIAATNRDLKEAIEERVFREDLYFRLSAFKITLPPLRERPLDILPLAHQFLDTQLSKGSRATITPEASEMLVSYSWPGNVRELQNVIVRAQVLSSQGLIQPDHLVFDDFAREDNDDSQWRDYPVFNKPKLNQDVKADKLATEGGALKAKVKASNSHQAESLSRAIKASEREIIMSVLHESKNREQAAEKLGISPRTLRHKLQRFRKDGMAVTAAYVR